MVLISKLGKDLALTKNWRPLNWINCLGKLGEKVDTERLQDYVEQLLHRHQYALVWRWLAVGVLYRSVVEARTCLDGGSSMGWVFWDVKGGFQNVRTSGVLNRALVCECYKSSPASA